VSPIKFYFNNVFFAVWSSVGHTHLAIRPLGWLAIVIIAAVVGYGMMRNR